MTPSLTPNHLAGEKSPYLLQHAHNPVDWYPWGEEAFAKARREDRPIFLSVGYATCHWCHVMEHESFENPDIAALLNEGFVAIKVDREERPDVDRLYISALQAMGIGGGWPMSMFLTPDLKPFYGGTYFPPENRHQRAGFPEILRRISSIWQYKRSEVLESGNRIVEYLQELAGTQSPEAVAPGAIASLCYDQLLQSFDGEYGGFGNSPKFPRPVTLAFLSRYHRRRPEAEAGEMVLRTLRATAGGGIRDHVGGGFHRYAVDAEWRVPHFEKMLYDQAQLLHAYLDAAQWTHDPFFAEVACTIADYVLRDLTLPGGGFASAEDADSPRPEDPGESGEGAFYVWTEKEITEILGSDAPLFAFAFGVEPGGNVTHDPQHEFTGRNILYAARTSEDIARFAGQETGTALQRLAQAKERIRIGRLNRLRPLRDDKVIAAWNGLMIGALARASAMSGISAYRAAAEHAALFVFTAMYDVWSGLLRRRFRDGEAKHEAHLEDYAFLAEGLLDLFEATGDPTWLERALDLTKTQIDLFWDAHRGGFFDTSGHDTSVLVRMREQYDGAEPAGNSVAARNLLRLGALTGNSEFVEKGRATVNAFSAWLEKQPSIMPYMVAASMMLEEAASQVVIVGRAGESMTDALKREVDARFLPGTAKIMVSPENQARMAKLIPYAGEVVQKEEASTAFVCANYVCRLPVNNPADLGAQLDEMESRMASGRQV
jgi:uncharacterized protein YyaL (SSP411 family)